MVTVVGNGLSNPSSNPGQGCLYFISYFCFWERHESICSPIPFLGLCSLALLRQLVKEKGKLLIHINFIPLKNWLCVIAERLVRYIHVVLRPQVPHLPSKYCKERHFLLIIWSYFFKSIPGSSKTSSVSDFIV